MYVCTTVSKDLASQPVNRRTALWARNANTCTHYTSSTHGHSCHLTARDELVNQRLPPHQARSDIFQTDKLGASWLSRSTGIDVSSSIYISLCIYM